MKNKTKNIISFGTEIKGITRVTYDDEIEIELEKASKDYILKWFKSKFPVETDMSFSPNHIIQRGDIYKVEFTYMGIPNKYTITII